MIGPLGARPRPDGAAALSLWSGVVSTERSLAACSERSEYFLVSTVGDRSVTDLPYFRDKFIQEPEGCPMIAVQGSKYATYALVRSSSAIKLPGRVPELRLANLQSN